VTDSQGNVINTTVGGGGPISFTGPTLSLDDIVTAINNNADVGTTALGGGGVTASVQTDANGAPYLQLQGTNTNARIVLSSATGDFPGLMGFNNLLTGTGSADIGVRADIRADPTLIPTARMRADGGVSSLSNTNMLELAKLADTKMSFDAAGGIGSQSITAAGYIGEITGSLAVTLQEAKSRAQYADTLHSQLQELKGSISGVNMNEELTLMLTYQQGFQASARLVTVVDSLLQELMNTVR
jgi:flagellar hook-associated protein 1